MSSMAVSRQRWWKVVDIMQHVVERLSPRQREILPLLAKGLTTKAVALRLTPPCSPETVKDHLGQIYTRLGVSGRVEAVAVWLRWSGSAKYDNQASR